jgi:hypothetical protein
VTQVQHPSLNRLIGIRPCIFDCMLHNDVDHEQPWELYHFHDEERSGKTLQHSDMTDEQRARQTPTTIPNVNKDPAIAMFNRDQVSEKELKGRQSRHVGYSSVPAENSAVGSSTSEVSESTSIFVVKQGPLVMIGPVVHCSPVSGSTGPQPHDPSEWFNEKKLTGIPRGADK